MNGRNARWALVIVWVTISAPITAVRAAEEKSATTTSATSSIHDIGATSKRDSKALVAAVKRAAHKVAVTAKAAAHAVASATQRGAAETRAAIKGEHATRTAAVPER
jgi:hypothetical protein